MCPAVFETVLIPHAEKETRTVDCVMEGTLVIFYLFFFLLLSEILFSCTLSIVPPDCGQILGSEPSGFCNFRLQLRLSPTCSTATLYAALSHSLAEPDFLPGTFSLKLATEEPLICS